MRRSIWKGITLGAAGALAALLLLVGMAAADEGPHGGYTATTGKCQACHSPHRATSIYILRGGTGTVYSFCTTCHGTGGDARTDVLAGQWTTGAGIWGGIPDAYGDTSKQLNAGRFSSAASTHTVNAEATGLTIWGGNSNTGADSTLSTGFRCTSCHDPHGKSLVEVGGSGTQANGGTDNYRLLENAAVKSWEATANYGTGVTKSYTRAAWQAGGIADFCTSCHADYKATAEADSTNGNKPSAVAGTNQFNGKWAHQINMTLGGESTNLGTSDYKVPVEGTSYTKWYWVDQAGPTASGAGAITTTTTAGSYSATNDRVTCTTCHNAHGSLATDAQTYASNASGDDSLLRFNDRTVCQSCHKKGF